MAEMGFLEALVGATKPGRAISDYRQTMRTRDALQELAGQPDLTAEQLLTGLGAATGSPDALMALAKYKRAQETGLNPDLPAAIQEYQYFSKLPEDQQKSYLGVKRAQQVLDLGSGYGVLGMGGQVAPVATKTLAPQDRPDVRGAQAAAAEQGRLQTQLGLQPQVTAAVEEAAAAAKARGSELGTAQASLSSLEANLPNLERVVGRLSELGKIATYTLAGQGRDFVMRQAGVDVPASAVARKEYLSTVDNEILPLLRQTFGAQFTEKEGESLKKTLGDPDASPSEKDAVLRSFITNKVEQIKSLQRQTGQNLSAATRPTKEQALEILRQRGVIK